MRYQPPVNSTPTIDNPKPAYFDGNPLTGQKGAIPPGRAIGDTQIEIENVILAAGMTPSENDLTQLWQAIQILAAGAGGAPASFAYNPVFPDVLTNDGVMSIAPSTGQVVLATGQQWTHRGGALYNSTAISIGDRTLSTVANKTYHMRWRYNGGAPTLLLHDLADVGYNPGAVAETDAQFDTAYDDMLIARVVTNGANLPAVTALYNKARLEKRFDTSAVPVRSGSPNFTLTATYTLALNWARTPKDVAIQSYVGITAQGTPPAVMQGGANKASDTITRYAIQHVVLTDWDSFPAGFGGDNSQLRGGASA